MKQKVSRKNFHIAVCPHHPRKTVLVEKPKTGLLDEIESKSRFKFTEKWLIGDNISDLIAGNKKQFNLILVKTGLGKNSLKLIHKNSNYDYLNFSICEDLNEAFQLITKKNQFKISIVLSINLSSIFWCDTIRIPFKKSIFLRNF